MTQKWFKMVVLSIALLLVSLPVWAGMEDIIQKQKKLEQEKDKEKIKAGAISSRSLEIFNIIASVVEELDNKGVKFEKITTLNRGGEEVYIWGPDWYLPVVTQQLGYKIVLIGEYLNDSLLMPEYKIIIKPKGGGTCYIKIRGGGRESTNDPAFNEEKEVLLKMSEPSLKHAEIKMIIPIYGSIEKKKADLRKNVVKLIERSME